MAGIVATVAGGYLLALGLLFVFQRQLLYYPSGERPSLETAGLAGRMTPVRLTTADGLELLAWYAAAAEGRPTVVYFHGNAGHIGYRADKVRPYLAAGLGVLLLEYRGYGGNPGRPDEEGLYADARAALDFLDGAGVAAERRVLYGESLGGAVAVQMAAERAAGAVVLEAPFTSVPEVGQSKFPIFPVRWLARDRLDSLAKIGAVGAPVLVLHGEQDQIVPIRFGRALFAAANEPKEMRSFPAAGHEDLDAHGIAEAVLDFLGRRLPAP
ncbi:MAG TPA: alpha/beta hydrolase [Dongiaceae bacterium]|nr:alpha/beta hydrolase [Dongiaceae bacterium]